MQDNQLYQNDFISEITLGVYKTITLGTMCGHYNVTEVARIHACHGFVCRATCFRAIQVICERVLTYESHGIEMHCFLGHFEISCTHSMSPIHNVVEKPQWYFEMPYAREAILDSENETRLKWM